MNAIYTGDVNRDGIVIAFDLSSVENDVTQGMAGYILTDLTGDNYTEPEDLAIVENNLLIGVSKITP